jgi:hypothetical protein
MKSLKVCSVFVFITGFLACERLMADTVFTVPGLPQGDVDTLSIQLSPANGTVTGSPGSVVGWGFTVNWTSTDGDWVVFTGSSLGSPDAAESNPAILALYTDFIGFQGGPLDFGLPPGSSPWTESFNSGLSTGVGSYRIASGAAIGAQDTGEITFDFEVYNGDPTTSGVQIGDLAEDYTYYASSTAFAVNVAAPEPNSAVGLAGALLIAGFVMRKRSKPAGKPFIG